jgi:DNA-directed RNA polymerase subunit RPC12/RpoP
MELQPSQKCPECGRHDFTELNPEKGAAVFLMFIFTFVLDLFTPGGGRPLQSVEAYNKGRPGWICNHCGWETRVKPRPE